MVTLVVGAAIILFKVAIPPRLGLTMELSVGLMLILLGFLNLTGILQRIMARTLPGSSEGCTAGMSRSSAVYLDGSGPSGSTSDGNAAVAPSTSTSMGLFNILRPLVVGIVHGLAGSAAVALLVMTTIQDPWWEIGYLLVFGLGTVIGMMVITALIAVPFVYTARKLSWWNRGMAVASGLLSLAFGAFLSYRIGIVDGLFAAHPHWIPQ